MDYLTNQTAMTVLHDAAQKGDSTVKELHEKLVKNGMKITFSSFYLYYKGDVAPPLEVLTEMSRALGLGYKENELKTIFRNTKEKVKENRTDPLYHLNLKLKLETISPEYRQKGEKFKLDLESRAGELFDDEKLAKKFKAGSKRQLSAYVAYLIEKDLEENGYVHRQN